MTARMARLVDRASGQVCREYCLEGLNPREVDDWYIAVVKDHDLTRMRLEFVPDPLGDDV
jgi:hypothetical protein